MATSSFDRRIEIANEVSAKKFLDAISGEPSDDSISDHPYGEKERKRSEKLLKKWLSLLNK